MAPAQAVNGQPIVVRGSGFPASSQVHVALCAFSVNAVPADCDKHAALTADISATGELAVGLTATQPSDPCPCVLRITDEIGSVSVTLPISLDGVAGPDPAAIAQQRTLLRSEVTVTDLALVGHDSWTTWFGAVPQRSLRATITNTGSEVVTDPPLLVTARRGSEVHAVTDVPPIGLLQPGQSRTIEVPVDLGGFGLGRLGGGDYTVEGHVLGLAQPVDFGVATSSRPWGLYLSSSILVILVAAALAWSARARQRRRPARAQAALAAAPPALAAATPALSAGIARRAPSDLAGWSDQVTSTITLTLTETLRELDRQLGGRLIDAAAAHDLAASISTGVATAVTDEHRLSRPQHDELESVLHTELENLLKSRVTTSDNRIRVF